MTLFQNNSRHERFLATIATGAAVAEWNTNIGPTRHLISVRVIDTNGDAATPAGATATIKFKAHKDDEFQALSDGTNDISLDLADGPFYHTFEMPVVALQVTGATLGTNSKMAVVWTGWSGEY